MENITKSALEIIGKNIKTARLMRELSQESLAEELNKSVNYVSLLENGKTGFSVPTIIDLCTTLQVDANFIFKGVIAPTDVMADDYIMSSLSLFNDSDKSIVADLVTYIVNSKN